MDDQEYLIDENELVRFGEESLMAVGANKSHASQHILVLVEADRRGHYSHGFNRLSGHYVADIRSKICDPNAVPEVVRQTVATALVDGKNSLGGVVGNFAMNVAIDKAKQTGVGWVTVRSSNHFGIAGHYSKQALNHGMLGMAFTNGSPYVSPTRACTQTLSTLPLSLAAPGENGDHMLLDMATSAAAVGKMELANAKGEPIPAGWALDKDGWPTTDPKAALPSGGGVGLPLGGPEENGGYKGYGLGLLVEVMCGILSGAAWGPNIRRWKVHNQVANLGQCFIALDPSAFTEDFTSRFQALMDTCRDLEPLDPDLPVIIPGDRGRGREEKVRLEGGVRYTQKQVKSMLDLANQLGIQPPAFKPVEKN